LSEYFIAQALDAICFSHEFLLGGGHGVFDLLSESTVRQPTYLIFRIWPQAGKAAFFKVQEIWRYVKGQ